MRIPLLLAMLLAASAAHAADIGVSPAPPPEKAPPATSAPDWVIQVSPYLWAAGIKGDVSPFRRAPTIAIEKSFSDVLDDLKMGGFLNAWARYDRFVFSADVMYVDMGETQSVGALPLIGPTPGLSATVVSTQFAATLQAGYRVFDDPKATLDLLAGVRWWEISTNATIRYAGYALSYGEDFGWVDPVVGLRGFYNVTDRFSAMVQADLGGFGVGAQFTWQVIATVNYAFTDSLSASVGYKVLDVDYNSGGHVFDAQLSGPVLGVTYRF